MKHLLLVAVFGLVGCGTLPPEWQLKKPSEEVTGPTPGCPRRVMARHYDIAFESYLEEFEQDAKKYEVGCYYTHSMYFAKKLPPGVAGYCTLGNRIVISSEVWETLEPLEKKTLIYHELGHCGLYLDHTASNVWAIMNPYLLPTYMLRGYWKPLVENLFETAEKEQRR